MNRENITGMEYCWYVLCWINTEWLFANDHLLFSLSNCVHSKSGSVFCFVCFFSSVSSSLADNNMGAALPSPAVQADTDPISQFWLAFSVPSMALASDLPNQHIPEVSFCGAKTELEKTNRDSAAHCDGVPAPVIFELSAVPGGICRPRLVAPPPPTDPFGRFTLPRMHSAFTEEHDVHLYGVVVPTMSNFIPKLSSTCAGNISCCFFIFFIFFFNLYD